MDALGHIGMLAMDADGVLTDGGLYFSGADILVRFDSKDGHGIRALMASGIAVAVISGRKRSAALADRCQQLGIDSCQCGVEDKLACAEGLLAGRGLGFESLAYIGDDIPDLPLLKRAGFAAAPADAVGAVREACDWVSSLPGGRGAVRELCDLILDARAKEADNSPRH